jgi:hypothetical protein
MKSPTIIESFNVFKQTLPGLRAGAIGSASVRGGGDAAVFASHASRDIYYRGDQNSTASGCTLMIIMMNFSQQTSAIAAITRYIHQYQDVFSGH